MKLLSLFAGCGGLDLGFKKAGFNIVWANEYDKTIYPTHNINFPETKMDTRSIRDIPSNELPQDVDGVIGGPPCQSWSEAGKGLGIDDQRGQLFYEYIRVIKTVRPKFFVAENVSGILHEKHRDAVNNIVEAFKELGYNVNYQLVNANDFDVPEDRLRVIFVGYRQDITDKIFNLEIPNNRRLTLKDCIWDLQDTVMPAKDKNKTNGDALKIPNNEYMTGGFSTIYMSRNRVRGWDEPSFTIQAGGRHAPIHPQAPKMIEVDKNKRIFVEGKENLYRRLSVRECARIQTFPDDFIFQYQSLADGYKMIGNAVPVNLAYYIAKQIKNDIQILENAA
ncbi:MAG: DNA cytosine methyltransferase [Alphaproteobacteria bacterium]|nr:DNA cytosine methyltransferase [Alphaproteobacteria bacterium]